MISEVTFHKQLINSFVNHVAENPFEETMLRSELLRRTREIVNPIGRSRGSSTEQASVYIFFDGDRRRYLDFLKAATNTDENAFYRINIGTHGRTTLLDLKL